MLEEIIGKYSHRAQSLAINEHKDQGGEWNKEIRGFHHGILLRTGIPVPRNIPGHIACAQKITSNQRNAIYNGTT
jgi:hypothetical protein